MNNCFPLDFIRQIIEQTLLEEHIKEPTKYFGGSNQVNLFSFYEQLQKDSEVNRYVEIYNDLVEQQNRSGLIMNGTIIAPENPTITNLYLDTIIPMTFTCSFRVTLGDRDMAITTINNLIEKLKGRKQDVALFENGQIFKVGTICNQFVENEIRLQTHSGDYIGEWDEDFDLDTYITTYIATDLDAKGIWLNDSNYVYYYLSRSESGGLIVAKRVPIISGGTTTYHWRRVFEGESGTEDILFPPEGDFDKYKVSMSFDSIRCDEPRNLNAKEYCTISFGGSATLVNNGVALGNDLVKLGITKNKIIASPNIVITENANLLSNATWLEPLEMPSGNSANTITNLLNSNRFNTNSHTTNITIANQYSFVLDRSIPLLDQLYKYGRYGYFGVDNSGETPSYTNAITPNMIFRVYEVNSSWGDVDVNFIDAKIVESIDIENTESDTLSMTLTLQKQGGNDIGGSGGGGGGGGSTDYVTTDTEQTITAKKTFTNQVVFTNTLSNGTYVYLLPQESGRLATQEWVSNQNYTTLSVISENYVSLATTQTITGDKSFKSSLSADKEIRITTSTALIESQYTTGYQYASFDYTGFYARHYRTPSTGYKFTADGFEYYVSDVLNATFLLPTGSGQTTYTIATQEWVTSDLNECVKTSGNQTIGGNKTFSGIIYCDNIRSTTDHLLVALNNNGVIGIGSGYDRLEMYGSATRPSYMNTDLALYSDLSNKQDTLVSGTNIKTIAGTSILGSGNISISASGIVKDTISITTYGGNLYQVLSTYLSGYYITSNNLYHCIVNSIRTNNDNAVTFGGQGLTPVYITYTYSGFSGFSNGDISVRGIKGTNADLFSIQSYSISGDTLTINVMGQGQSGYVCNATIRITYPHTYAYYFDDNGTRQVVPNGATLNVNLG